MHGSLCVGRSRKNLHKRKVFEEIAMKIVKAAAVQMSPVLYSREGTVEKVVRKIHELGARGRAVRHVSGDRGALLPVLFVRPARLPDHCRT